MGTVSPVTTAAATTSAPVTTAAATTIAPTIPIVPIPPVTTAAASTTAAATTAAPVSTVAATTGVATEPATTAAATEPATTAAATTAAATTAAPGTTSAPATTVVVTDPATTAAPIVTATTAAPVVTTTATPVLSNVGYKNCGNYQECIGESAIIYNPLSGFKLECSDVESCKGAKFQFVMDSAATAPIVAIEALIMSGQDTFNGGFLSIDNQQPSFRVDVKLLECSNRRSCAGATFVTGPNTNIQSVICAADACNGCVIKENVNDVGIPCDPNQSATTAPVTTAAPVNPVSTAGPAVTTAPVAQATEFKCTQQEECMGQTQVIINPANGFYTECGDVSSCQNTNFIINLEVTAPEPITAIGTFKFSGENGFKLGFLSINNMQTNGVDVDLIECSNTGSCEDATFTTTGTVNINSFKCAAGACYGCTIDGVPCDPAQLTKPVPTTAAPATTAAAVTANPVNPAIPANPEIPANPAIPAGPVFNPNVAV